MNDFGNATDDSFCNNFLSILPSVWALKKRNNETAVKGITLQNLFELAHELFDNEPAYDENVTSLWI